MKYAISTLRLKLIQLDKRIELYENYIQTEDSIEIKKNLRIAINEAISAINEINEAIEILKTQNKKQ